MRTTARQTRENRTITVDFQNEATYFQLLGDSKAFVECVVAFRLCLVYNLTLATSRGKQGLTAPTTVVSQILLKRSLRGSGPCR